ncbi:MAG: efflux RND transporter permease subunit [Gammaproteobacteria bacterium]|nr:efflux RND transporter permease subunit [Gammaproteobacteria bacterium]
MNISRFFILRPIATSLLMLGILLSGLLAYRFLPLSALPQVDYPTIQISAFYPGASPEVVASTLVAPLEKQLGQMPSLAQMHSNSTSGAATITLRFELNLPLDVAEQQVQAAMNAANNLLPADLPAPPIYHKVNPADAPIMTIAVTSATLSRPQLQDLVETRLAMKLSQLSGVGLVSIAGNQRPAIRVQLNPSQIAALGLSFDTIRTLINDNNLSMSKGSLQGPYRSSTIDANDQLKTPDDYRALIVAYQNGNAIRLGDIASLVEEAQNQYLSAWLNEQPAILLNIQRQPNANVIAVTDRIRQSLPELTANFPASVQVDVVTDRTQSIRQALTEMSKDMLIAIILVVAVIFIFLNNLKATLIPSLAIPLSLVGTLGIMYLLGFSINNLTLMAMVVATGFVVDDAIVMIENIARRREAGESALTAAINGAGQVGFTIISLTFSLTAVLIPLLFMQDIIGRLFREFALTLTLAMLISAVISLTLTPMMAAYLSGNRKAIPDHSLRTSWFTPIQTHYLNALSKGLAHQPLTLMVSLALVLISALLYWQIPKSFFPVQDTGILTVTVDAPAKTSFVQQSALQQALSKTLLTDPAVKSISSFIGVDGQNMTPNSGRMAIQLIDKNQRDDAPLVIERLRHLAAEHNQLAVYIQPSPELTVEDQLARSPYQFKLSSPFHDDLAQASDQLVSALQSLPQLSQVSSDLNLQGQQVFIDIDRDQATRLGVTVKQIDAALYNAFGQRLIATIFTQSNQYRVVMEMADSAAQGLDKLSQVYVLNTQQQAIPLNRVAKFELKSTALSLQRLDQFPSASIAFAVNEGYSLGDAVAAIQQTKASLDLPKSVELKLQGATLAFEKSLANSLLLLLAAIITVYIVLGMLYESLIHPVTILSTLPAAAIGALIALSLAGFSLDIIGVIGLILLIGLVMKNAIMMIDFALEGMRQEHLSAEAAIIQACRHRLRPILMTTFAALFGALPLMLSTGLGEELRQPMGYAIVGGLLLSQLITLFTTPVIFLQLEKRFPSSRLNHHE